jgi:hypothetical protein
MKKPIKLLILNLFLYNTFNSTEFLKTVDNNEYIISNEIIREISEILENCKNIIRYEFSTINPDSNIQKKIIIIVPELIRFSNQFNNKATISKNDLYKLRTDYNKLMVYMEQYNLQKK